MSRYLNTTTKALSIDETNGNSLINSNLALVSSFSNEDLSQSLSEYTDADDMSAPTEILAEFLSALMLKDYKNALKYCKSILQFEPNNTTAIDFYPHIMTKIRESADNTTHDDENDNYTESDEQDPDNANESAGASSSSIDESNSSPNSMSDYSNASFDDEEGAPENEGPNFLVVSHSKSSSNNSNTSSSSAQPANSSDEPANNKSSGSNTSSSNHSRTSSSAMAGISDNTTHSYDSSLLLDLDDDADNTNAENLHLRLDDLRARDNDRRNGNDFESNARGVAEPRPTAEPLTLKVITMLRNKCIPPKLANSLQT